ncbi:MAG: hypothetical protein BWK76_27150 [Desulfobulbaceae bacterium A2]|nr:MAG: hypothetical protein BWK76_27150 [Desulfobulbaceae bacterium A2]
MEQLETIEQALAGHPFCHGLDENYRRLLCKCANRWIIAPGNYLYREGAPGHHCHLLCQGRVALEVHLPGSGPLTIETLGAGDVVGWSWLVPPYRARFDARVLETLTVLSIEAACLRHLCEQDHELGFALYQRFLPLVAERLAATRLRLVDMYEGRVAVAAGSGSGPASGGGSSLSFPTPRRGG